MKGGPGNMWRREKKVAVTLTHEEVRLMTRTLVEYRNMLIKKGLPTEDIDRILIRLYK